MMEIDELALSVMFYEWPAWARPKQIPPENNWKSWGFVAGRGMGKTRAACQFIVGEIMAGRARRVGFTSFNFEEAEKTLMHGESGLVRCSPPWFPATVVKGQVVWPNGAIATPYTPEVPAGPRGPEHDLFWCSEMQSWPAATRDEFFSNVKMGLRLGLARMVFDCTPKARNPLIRYLVERSRLHPDRHVLVRGSTHENADNLSEGFVAELESEYGGTLKGREELLGEYHDDSDGALFQQAWIDRSRREMPTEFKRRIVTIDPSISVRRGTDACGLLELGLGIDDQVYVIADHTDRMPVEVWVTLAIELYVKGRCDALVCEKNRGGDLIAASIRAFAGQRGLRVEVVDAKAPTRWVSGMIYIKETWARVAKEVRAAPCATAMERGRVSFVRGADLQDLEEVLTTWVPDGKGESPNSLDALSQGVVELLGLSLESKPDTRAAISGAVAVQKALAAQTQRKPVNVAAVLGGRRGGDRI